MKLGFTEKQVGHMTFRKWHSLYKAYKNNFDLEMTLLKSRGLRYMDIGKENSIDDVIPY